MKSFLKWAGGKHRLVPKIMEVLPRRNRLVEPFLGSASVFLGTDFESYLLADINPDLINVYTALQTKPDDIIQMTCDLFKPETNTVERFYELRAEFNSLLGDLTNPRRSALFVYLNKHAFNGLCRYNSKGGYNVPYGKYAGPVCPSDAMQDFAAKSHKAEFRCVGFEELFKEVKDGDCIYSDPPYVAISATASFSAYFGDGFSNDQQMLLARLSRENADKGIPSVISNHDTPESRLIYADATEVKELEVSRTISAKSASRKPVKEIFAIYT